MTVRLVSSTETWVRSDAHHVDSGPMREEVVRDTVSEMQQPSSQFGWRVTPSGPMSTGLP